MTRQEVRQVYNALSGFDKTFIETHISWVLLAGEYAFKCKRPVRYTFVDFSTRERRHHFCKEEVRLNRRLTTDVYFGVDAIVSVKEGFALESDPAEDASIVDYAVRMKRLDTSRQMHVLLKRNEVTPRHMEQIAGQLSVFHRNAERIPALPGTNPMFEDFADISGHRDAARTLLGNETSGVIDKAIAVAEGFLADHEPRMQQRFEEGQYIDGHGDLHSKNIFLLDEPVIFDCIEFNPHFRQLDILDELAFFSIDLEMHKKFDLEAHFMRHYQLHNPTFETDEDHAIFLYYKLYRSGVKLKINLLKATQASDSEERDEKHERAKQYYAQFAGYLTELMG